MKYLTLGYILSQKWVKIPCKIVFQHILYSITIQKGPKMFEKFIEHENIVIFLITSLCRWICHKFAKNSLICKKAMKSQNLSQKKSFLFQYWMSIKLLCILGVCHDIHFKMTINFEVRIIQFAGVRKILSHLFASDFRQTIIKYSKDFDFVGTPEYSGYLQIHNICKLWCVTM